MRVQEHKQAFKFVVRLRMISIASFCASCIFPLSEGQLLSLDGDRNCEYQDRMPLALCPNFMCSKYYAAQCSSYIENRKLAYLGGVHAGDNADARMAQAAKKRGINLTSKSRPLRPQDLQRFDFIVGMDPMNLKAMQVRTC
jgi:hypothetical protein